MAKQEIFGWFDAEDVGTEIEISGRVGPRWFYAPIAKAKEAVLDRLHWKVSFYLYRAYAKIVPIKVHEFREWLCYIPSPNGIYKVLSVEGNKAVVESMK